MTRTSVFWAIVEYLKAVSVIVSGTALIVGGSYTVFKTPLAEMIKGLVGTESILEAMETQNDQISGLKADVAALNTRMNEAIPRAVREYDILRSRIISPCALGRPCDFSYRVRRTPWGKDCAEAKETFMFEDSAGTAHYPEKPEEQQPRRKLTAEWAIIPSSFRVPKEASLGFGEFYLILDYAGCGENGATITETSTPLVVEIIP